MKECFDVRLLTFPEQENSDWSWECVVLHVRYDYKNDRKVSSSLTRVNHPRPFLREKSVVPGSGRVAESDREASCTQ